MMKRLFHYLKAHHIRSDKWQKQNPSKTHQDFYAESVEFKLRKGKSHRNLGSHLFDGEHGTSGKGFIEKLLALGLKPDDTCVDYGCGTLRLGIHAINYLQPGAYWGMDISEFLLEEGRRLIGDGLWAKKQPHLRVISAESVAEAAAAKPTMLFSVKVLIHVHPAELAKYFQNIMTIIGASGQAIITGKWSEKETLRYSQLSWAHSIDSVQGFVKAEGGNVEIIREQECRLEHVDHAARSGMLRIVHDSSIARHHEMRPSRSDDCARF
jgi:hypothetical protein